MQRDGSVLVRHGGGREFVGDLGFRGSQNYAAAALALCLCFARHRILQVQRNLYVTDFDRLYGDAPGSGLFIEDLLEFLAKRFALGKGLMKVMAPDRLSQRGL